MELQLWASYAAAALLLAIIPGPGVATIVGFAVGSGRRTALAAAGGMAIGNLVAVSLSLAGAGALLAASALAFTALKMIGAAYLIGLGLFAILRARPKAQADGAIVAPRRIRARTAFLGTVAVGTFHPKTILFFMAFASQFVVAERPFLPQAAILTLTFVGIALVTDSLYAIAASRASAWFRRPATALWSRRLGGGVLIGAGVATAAMRRQ